MQYNENVLKVDQLITKEIIILFTHSIKILNNNYQEIGEIKINCINFEIISDKIIILGPDNISINKYNGKNELIKIEQFDYYSINSVKNIICLDENTFAVIGQKNILYYDLKNYEAKLINHGIINPLCITKLDKSSFLIWNLSGKILLFEIDKNECIFFEINSIKTNNINSIIKLFDGSVIIAKEGIKNFEIKKKLDDNENCIIY